MLHWNVTGLRIPCREHKKMSELQSLHGGVHTIANGSCHAMFGILFCYLCLLFRSKEVIRHPLAQDLFPCAPAVL